MFKNKYYEQAMMCFEKGKNQEYYKRAKAFYMAESASKQ